MYPMYEDDEDEPLLHLDLEWGAATSGPQACWRPTDSTDSSGVSQRWEGSVTEHAVRAAFPDELDSFDFDALAETKVDRVRNGPKGVDSWAPWRSKETVTAWNAQQRGETPGTQTPFWSFNNFVTRRKFKEGDRVKVEGHKCAGIVRHVGKKGDHPHSGDQLLWIGVELDKAVGDNDGIVGGHRYFTCPPLTGVLVSPDKVHTVSDVSKLEKENGYRVLDKCLWEWSEHDDDAKACAPFTKAGVAASSLARAIIMFLGSCITVSEVYSNVFAEPKSWPLNAGATALMLFGLILTAVDVLYRLRWPRSALRAWKWAGFLPAGMLVVNAVLICEGRDSTSLRGYNRAESINLNLEAGSTVTPGTCVFVGVMPALIMLSGAFLTARELPIKVPGILDFKIGGPKNQLYTLASMFSAGEFGYAIDQLGERRITGVHIFQLLIPFIVMTVTYLFYLRRIKAIWGTHCASCQRSAISEDGTQPMCGHRSIDIMKRTCVDQAELKLDDRVKVDGYACAGTVRFVGKNKTTDKLQIGVELDKAIGNTNGTVAGELCFVCPPRYGLLVSPNKVSLTARPPTGCSALMPTGCSAGAQDVCNHGAKDIIRSSIIRYNELWAEVDTVENRSRHYEATGLEPEVSLVRSLTRKWSELELDRLDPNPEQPIDSLGELFLYSYVVNTWFQTKCWLWMKELGLQDDYSWISIKQEERAIEKARRSYGGVVQRLLDIVRGSLVVDNLAQVEQLLEIVAADTDVEIVRGKNRFSSDMKDLYRDVQLTVRCKAFSFDALPGYDAARTPLIKAHTCKKLCAEVQIHLRSFYDFKNEQSHTDYKKYRAIMGE